MLKCGKHSTDFLLLPLLQACFDNEEIYDHYWRHGTIIPLMKSGDPCNTDNYRGITLHSALGKMFATVVAKRMSDYVESKNLISTYQNGFRARRSCNDHVLTLQELLLDRKSKGKSTWLFFLDFKKAFDLLKHDVMLVSLHKLGIKGKLWRIVKRLYKNMKSVVKVQGISDPFDIKVGVAQGCPLSVYLFSAAINSLLVRIEEAGLGACFSSTDGSNLCNGPSIPCLAFADDIVATCDNREDLQKIIKICHEWTCEFHMCANATKSAVMVAGDDQIHPPLMLGDDPLPMVQKYKYLGVKFESNLAFEIHRNSVKSKCSYKNKLVKDIVSDPRLARTLQVQVHEALINTSALYCSETWSWGYENLLRAIDTESARHFLNLHNFPWKGSNTACRALHGRNSLIYHRNITALTYWFRTICTSFKYPGRANLIAINSASYRNHFKSRIIKLLQLGNFSYDQIVREARDRSHTLNPFGASEFKSRVANSVANDDRSKTLYNLRFRSNVANVLLDQVVENDAKLGCSSKDRSILLVGGHFLGESLADVSERLLLDSNTCVGCGRDWEGLHHCFCICPAWKNIRDFFILNCADNSIDDLLKNNSLPSLRKILVPQNWNKRTNLAINNYCRSFARHAQSLYTSHKMPTLAPLLNPIDRNALNENICGEVFDLNFTDDGTYRMKATEYDASTNLFEIDSTGLDIWVGTGAKFVPWSSVGINLNEMLKNNQIIRHVTSSFALSNEQLKTGVIFNHNLIGQSMNVKLQDRRWHTGAVVDYENNKHKLRFKEGELSRGKLRESGDGDVRWLDLHRCLSRGALRMPNSPHVLAHLKEYVSATRSPSASCEVDARKGMADS